MLSKSTLPRSSSGHHWVVPVLRSFCGHSSAVSAQARQSWSLEARAQFLLEESPTTVAIRVHQLHRQLLLISAGITKPRQGAGGKRKPDKHRGDWDIVTQVRCSQGLLTSTAVSRFVLFKNID